MNALTIVRPRDIAGRDTMDGMPHLHLRPWTSADAVALLETRATSPDLSTQFSGQAWETVDDARAVIARELVFGDHARNWAIVREGEPVGNVGLSAIDRRHGTAWAFYWVRADARGQALATRALASVAAWAFADDLFRLELGHRVNNPASCRVAARAGFTAEGIERAKLRYGDERFDVETHARLATDPAPAIDLLPIETGTPALSLERERAVGGIHHIELRVADLTAAVPPWEWLLGELGYLPHQEWPDGRSWLRESSYVVLENAPRAGAHDRRMPGLSHLAFHAGSRANVDRLWAAAPAHGWAHLYADRWPWAGGPGHYAAFVENAERVKVELVAGDGTVSALAAS